MSILYKYVLKNSCNVLHVRLELMSDKIYKATYSVKVKHEESDSIIWETHKRILLGGDSKNVYDDFYLICNHNKVGKYVIDLRAELPNLGISKTSETKETDYYYVVDVYTRNGKFYLRGINKLPSTVILKDGKKKTIIIKQGMSISDIKKMIVGGTHLEVPFNRL